MRKTHLLTLLGGKWAKSLVLLSNWSRQKKYCKLKALLSLWLNFVFSARGPKLHFVEYEREAPASAGIDPFSLILHWAAIWKGVINFCKRDLNLRLCYTAGKVSVRSDDQHARVLLCQRWSWSGFAIHSQRGMFPSLKGTAISSTSRWKGKSTNYFFIVALVLLWAFK